MFFLDAFVCRVGKRLCDFSLFQDLRQWLRHLVGDETRQVTVRGEGGYQWQAEQGGSLLITYTPKYGIYVEGKGRYFSRLALFIYSVSVVTGVKAKRVDVAFDDVRDCSYDENAHIKQVLNNMRCLQSAGHIPERKLVLIEDVTGGGCTLGVGARGSRLYGRLYNKRAEQGIALTEPAWLRGELEISAESAIVIADSLARELLAALRITSKPATESDVFMVHYPDNFDAVCADVASKWLGVHVVRLFESVGIDVPLDARGSVVSELEMTRPKVASGSKLEWLKKVVRRVIDRERALLGTPLDDILIALGLPVSEK